MMQKNTDSYTRRGRAPQDMKPSTPPPTFVPNEKDGKEVKMGKQGPGYNNNPPYGNPKGFMPHGGPYEQPGGGPGQSVKAIDSGAIFPCIYHQVYIWPNRGPGYWMYVTYVGPRSIAGWVWNGRFWVYQGVDLRRIRKFYCY